jgi:hypothetical protein
MDDIFQLPAPELTSKEKAIEYRDKNIQLPNTVPIPVPAPIKPAAAVPAPMSLPAVKMAAPTVIVSARERLVGVFFRR